MGPEDAIPLILSALRLRNAAPDEAVRFFNGFYEGYPPLSIDRYGDTIVFQSFAKSGLDPVIQNALMKTFRADPTVSAILLKERFSKAQRERNGVFLFGEKGCERVREFGVSYPIRLTLNQDCSFYLDTALLRKHLIENSGGKTVLNTFAYTGSLGLAALAGGARKVVQTDLKPAFLEICESEAERMGARPNRHESVAADFFALTTAYRRAEKLFDIVLLDPPFFSLTGQGRVDQERSFIALINKARPLVADGGTLIVVNNALYLSGAALLSEIRSCLPSEYITPLPPISVPESFTGGASAKLPADPAPFNHPTKILPLRVRRKDGRGTSE